MPETGTGNETIGDATWSPPPCPSVHAFPDASPLALKILVMPGKFILFLQAARTCVSPSDTGPSSIDASQEQWGSSVSATHMA